ncbi:hypothetical protein [Oleiagrimonas sp. C23AA]|uniref:hypothetical protein n=1 Tax=Oleiagrimonas sp. C23AA TaxID=2719047 RepID=UPI001422C86B|nr:hypothetical protein [Oleiagrimonas sp. C23AA]NII10177.1 hypothetical protein [Oleiagrimonas sp. C23AA]
MAKSSTPGAMMGVGVALGAGLGVAFDNLALGMGIGVALGAALTAVAARRDMPRRKRDDDSRR